MPRRPKRYEIKRPEVSTLEGSRPELLARHQVRYASVPIFFADSRKLAEVMDLLPRPVCPPDLPGESVDVTDVARSRIAREAAMAISDAPSRVILVHPRQDIR